MEVKEELKYTKTHEWAKFDTGRVRIGITDYAQSELGDVVFVELPEIGTEVAAGDSAMSVESVKAVSEIYSPVSGKIVSVNSDLEQKPELINEAAFEGGWLFEIEADESALSDLLSSDEYLKELS